VAVSQTARPFDRVVMMAAPAVLILLALFVYPFAYGLWVSFRPKDGGAFANYLAFFGDPYLYQTVATTLWLALPVTVLNIVIAVPVALRVRLLRNSRILTTILVLPITLGVVLIAQGLLTYLGPQGWLNRALTTFGIASHPVRLVHNYWGVFLSLFIAGFPFTFLLTLSYVTGLDPAIEQAAATLGADARQRFWRIILPLLAPGLATAFCLSFVQAFSVFPSAILLGAPAGPTRVISIAAYQAAFEDYDYSRASAIAMIMGATQLVIIAIVLGARGYAYRGPASGGKG
jgi:putative spermidine/putrescine transport system permease protein